MVAEPVPAMVAEPDPSLEDPVFALHRGGKIAMTSTVALHARDFTRRSHAVAVVTERSTVLGLGDIGPAAALPVMEGKALLFQQFGGVDAVPPLGAFTTSTLLSVSRRKLALT